MLQSLALVLAALYSFTYLRVPGLLLETGVPLQFLAGGFSLVVLIADLLVVRPRGLGRLPLAYLTATALFLAYLLLDLCWRWASSQAQLFNTYFDGQLFCIDFLKYTGCFSVGLTVYYALRRTPELFIWLERTLIGSAIASLVLSFGMLGLYYAGYQTESSFLARAFEYRYMGVWPANGLDALPRLAGTALEPQQFSTVFLTPLLLMLSPGYCRWLWPWVVAGLVALVLAQSKFALASLGLVLLYAFLIYRPLRPWIGWGTLLLAPPALYLLSRLPVFSQTLEEGLEATAFVERLANLDFLLYQISNNFWDGSGPGQYATYINDLLHFDLLERNYIPGLDYLKIFAETGVIGFAITGFLLWQAGSGILRGLRTAAPEQRESYLAVLLGTFGLMLSMLFMYQYLQNLFWINLGLLMFLAEEQPEGEQSPHWNFGTRPLSSGLPTQE